VAVTADQVVDLGREAVIVSGLRPEERRATLEVRIAAELAGPALGHAELAGELEAALDIRAAASSPPPDSNRRTSDSRKR
jgi:hypothetical protein